MISAIQHGFGRHNAYIAMSSYNAIFGDLLGIFMTGVIVSGFARVSIACLLLRITTGQLWRAVIWAALAVQILFVISYEAVQLAQCQSIIAGKVVVKDSTCLTKAQILAFTYVSIGKFQTDSGWRVTCRPSCDSRLKSRLTWLTAKKPFV